LIDQVIDRPTRSIHAESQTPVELPRSVKLH
jgi:hypothetical protein